MNKLGVHQVQGGSGEQGKMEETGCEIICGAPTTLAVKGQMRRERSVHLSALGCVWLTVSVPFWVLSAFLSGSFCLSQCLCICTCWVFICHSVWVLTRLSQCLGICLHVRVSVPCLSICLRVCLRSCLSDFLTSCPSYRLGLSACLSVWVSVHVGICHSSGVSASLPQCLGICLKSIPGQSAVQIPGSMWVQMSDRLLPPLSGHNRCLIFCHCLGDLAFYMNSISYRMDRGAP